LCREKSLQYVVAPNEADAQIAFLVRSGHADFAISEDSDLLAYGSKQWSPIDLGVIRYICHWVLFKLQLSGSGDLIKMNLILESVGVDQPSFLNICIAAGCDYLPNVKCVGIVTTTKVVKEN
ncbi:Exonuclease 1, partial [Paramuricea clavata]